MSLDILKHSIEPSEESMRRVNDMVAALMAPKTIPEAPVALSNLSDKKYEEGVVYGIRSGVQLCVSVLQVALEAIDRGDPIKARADISALLNSVQRIEGN